MQPVEVKLNWKNRFEKVELRFASKKFDFVSQTLLGYLFGYLNVCTCAI
jgi:hypothetical protein